MMTRDSAIRTMTRDDFRTGEGFARARSLLDGFDDDVCSWGEHIEHVVNGGPDVLASQMRGSDGPADEFLTDGNAGPSADDYTHDALTIWALVD